MGRAQCDVMKNEENVFFKMVRIEKKGHKFG
jgi:hypothetical protein